MKVVFVRHRCLLVNWYIVFVLQFIVFFFCSNNYSILIANTNIVLDHWYSFWPSTLFHNSWLLKVLRRKTPNNRFYEWRREGKGWDFRHFLSRFWLLRETKPWYDTQALMWRQFWLLKPPIENSVTQTENLCNSYLKLVPHLRYRKIDIIDSRTHLIQNQF